MNSRDRLIELIQSATKGCSFQCAEKTADYLIEHGVIVLPCKVGDRLYLPWVGDGIRSVEVLTVTRIILGGIHDGAEFFICTNYGDRYDYRYGRFDFVDIGQEVFFDREDAEKKLAERSKDNDIQGSIGF